jgi:hypothetical protein
MTLPLLFRAANACCAEGYTAMTPEDRLEDTELEFPPESESPHVITLPLLFKAAKARWFEYTATTPDVKLEDTALEFPPYSPYVDAPHVTTRPSLFIAAKA